MTLLAACLPREFYAQIPGSGFNKKYSYYTLPCDSVPQLALYWGGKTWPIDTDYFNLPKSAATALALVAVESNSNNAFLLGDTFMKGVYTAFSVDTGKNSVGLAELAKTYDELRLATCTRYMYLYL
ncbi:hypothetical protein BD310DRAFT_981626 [Dichomitus squalens]|uniref:Peptidase A1 domain-containing protein n=1 Tax=Dichomitus squalens TaxID=114155 RepID=A0A4Q9PD34_9APHY|nr:hypothetical protein BD310DRAFT_981626 [Dichomitus squalens]